MKMIELLDFLVSEAKDYRKNCVSSINLNQHMNKLNGQCDISQEAVDAVLTDFINKIASKRSVDLALYTKDLV